LWPAKWVRHFISTRFGIAYGRERGRQRLHALGVRLRRLRHRHLKAQPEEQAAFRADLAALPAEGPEDCESRFVDEATVRRHPTLAAQGWVGADVPEGPTGDDHTPVPVYGAAAPPTGRTHDHVSPALGQGEFAQLLQHRSVYSPGKRRLVSHDRGAQQKGTSIEEVGREAAGRLVLTPQPACSPGLNPQERIWTWLRRVVTHHHGFATPQEPSDAIRNFFRSLAGVKAQVRR
jgi:hypothetical protein